MNASEARDITKSTMNRVANIDRCIINGAVITLRGVIDVEIEKAAKSGESFCRHDFVNLQDFRYAKVLIPGLEKDRFKVHTIKQFNPEAPWRMERLTLIISWDDLAETELKRIYSDLERRLLHRTFNG